MVCYGVTKGRGWCQEVYGTGSGDAGTRTRELRRLGLKVTSAPMGPQVTRMGVVKLTVVTVHGDCEVPAPLRVAEI